MESGVIQLRDSSTKKPLWRQTNSDLMSNAEVHKINGMELFRQDEIQSAFHEFSSALKFLIAVQQDQLSEDSKKRHVALKLSCYLNLAACQLKTAKFEHVVVNCTKALALDPNSVKGLYRRAVARTLLQDYELANQDLRKALTLDPNNKMVLQQLDVVRLKVKELDRLYGTAMQKMFG